MFLWFFSPSCCGHIHSRLFWISFRKEKVRQDTVSVWKTQARKAPATVCILKNLWILKLVCTRTKCNRTSFWETRLTPPWPILYMSESILCFYWRTSKCSCAPHNTLYSLQSPRCPECPPHCPAAPRRCGAGCWICALLDVCLHYCHTERYMAIFQWSRLKIINPSAAQKYCQNKQF